MRGDLQDLVRHLRTGIHKMLAVVEQDQHPFIPQVIAQHIDDRALRLIPQPDRDGGGARHQQRVKERRQLHEPHAVDVLGQQLTGRLDGQARFARAARPDQGEQGRVQQEFLYILQFFFTPHKTGELCRQIVGDLTQRLERRKIVLQPRCEDLPETFQPGQSPQPVLSHITQGNSRRQFMMKQLGAGIGDQDLPPISNGHDPLGFRQGEITLVVSPVYFGGTGMQSHADPEWRFSPILLLQPALRLHRRLKSIANRGEGNTKGIAYHLEDNAMVCIHGRPQDHLVALAQTFPGLRMLLGQQGTAFNVREEKGDSAGR